MVFVAGIIAVGASVGTCLRCRKIENGDSEHSTWSLLWSMWKRLYFAHAKKFSKATHRPTKGEIMEKKSVTIEKNTHGDAIALVTGGKRFPSENGSFDIPQEIAETIRLADLGPGIIINFVEKHDLGIAFRAIQKINGRSGRSCRDGPAHDQRLEQYGQLRDLCKGRSEPLSRNGSAHTTM